MHHHLLHGAVRYHEIQRSDVGWYHHICVVGESGGWAVELLIVGWQLGRLLLAGGQEQNADEREIC